LQEYFQPGGSFTLLQLYYNIQSLGTDIARVPPLIFTSDGFGIIEISFGLNTRITSLEDGVLPNLYRN
jgi:hypothetical protein